MGARARGSRGLAIAVAVALMAAAAPVSSAFSAGGTLEPNLIKVAKHKRGPYDHATQINIPEGGVKNLFWRVRNVTGGRLDPLGISDGAVPYPPGWTTKWFKGKKNVTEAVHTLDGYEFGLRRGATKKFRQRIKAPEVESATCIVTAAGNDSVLGLASAGVNLQKCGP